MEAHELSQERKPKCPGKSMTIRVCTLCTLLVTISESTCNAAKRDGTKKSIRPRNICLESCIRTQQGTQILIPGKMLKVRITDKATWTKWKSEHMRMEKRMDGARLHNKQSPESWSYCWRWRWGCREEAKTRIVREQGEVLLLSR